MDLNKQPETIAEALALASQWNFKHVARIAALEAALAEAREWKDKWETCEKWRKAYQEAKGELFAMGGEIAEAVIQHMPCNEATVDRWFRAEYVHKTAFERVTTELSESRKDGERLDEAARGQYSIRYNAMNEQWEVVTGDLHPAHRRSASRKTIRAAIDAARGTK